LTATEDRVADSSPYAYRETQHMVHLVVGGSGMLGQALLRELRDRGHEAIGASLQGPDRVLDISDGQMIEQIVEETKPDVIWNAAAIVSLARCEEDPGGAYVVNARAVSLLLDAINAAKTRLVHISTDHFFTGDETALHDESAPVTLVNEYARTKFVGEQFALTEPTALVLRTNVTGFRGWTGQPTFAEWVFNSVKDDAPVTMFADFFTSTIDVASFSSAACDMVEKGARGLYNLASSEVASKRTFIEAVAGRLGLALSRASIGSVRSLKPRRAESGGLDVTRAESLLGRGLPGLTDTVDTLVRRYRGES